MLYMLDMIIHRIGLNSGRINFIRRSMILGRTNDIRESMNLKLYICIYLDRINDIKTGMMILES